MVCVPVRRKTPQVVNAEWIWAMVSRASGEVREGDMNRELTSMTGI